jgi:hypothetical protein
MVPLRPLRIARRTLGALLVQVPLHAFAAGLLLRAAAIVLTRGWSDAGRVAAAGEWTLTTAYALIGLAGGALAGLIAAARTTVSGVEDDLRAWIEGLSPEHGRTLFPGVELERLEADYRAGLDRLADATLEHLPLPGIVRRFVRSRYRIALLEDFVQYARATGSGRAGFGELRNWLLLRGLPWLGAPVYRPLRIWRAAILGVLAMLAVLAIAVGVFAGVAEAGPVVMATFGVAAAVLLVRGLRARDGQAPSLRHRVGVITLAAQLAGWPYLYGLLWPLDPGGAGWIAVLVVTLLTVRWSLARMVSSSGRPL